MGKRSLQSTHRSGKPKSGKTTTATALGIKRVHAVEIVGTRLTPSPTFDKCQSSGSKWSGEETTLIQHQNLENSKGMKPFKTNWLSTSDSSRSYHPWVAIQSTPFQRVNLVRHCPERHFADRVLPQRLELSGAV